MAADPKAHQLYKQINGTLITAGNYAAPPAVLGSASQGWEAIEAVDAVGTATEAFVFRTYIDLSGWSQQELTTFTQGVDIQKGLIPWKNLLAPLPAVHQTDGLYEFDFLTTRKMTNAELGDLGALPGFLPSTADLMELIYAERMIYAENSQVAGTFLQIGGESFGSGNPTAMDKLHWTRLVFLHNSLVGDQVVIYPTNLVVQAITLEEKDLVWIERLRRSYVLQDEASV